MDETLQRWLDEHIFTPSEIEDTLLCPYRFYASSFLKLEEPPVSEPELTPREIGTLTHRILEEFLERGSAGGGRERLQALTSSVLAHFQKGRPGLSRRLVERQRTDIGRMLDSFFKMEVEGIAPEGGLRPQFFEWAFGTSQVPPLEISKEISNGGGRPIRIRGRVDRIDVDPERKLFLVIDYKTGTHKTTGKEIIEGRSLALPLYILAVQRLLLPGYEPAGGLFFHLSDMTKENGLLHADRIGSLALHPKKSSLVPEHLWDRTMEGIEEKVREIVGQIRTGVFPSQSAPCEPFCPFKDICLMRSQQPTA